ncbi:MAG: phosphohydrolase, partial [Eudoraea sp.]|nr:phosphohydrolase [Eudoraea sp.]
MGKTLDSLYRKQSLIYKYFLYIVAVGCIVFFFPKGGQFKYEFQKGKPWQYANLYAPFDFSIKKSPEEIAREREEVEKNQIDYYYYDEEIAAEVFSSFEENFSKVFTSQKFTEAQINTLKNTGRTLLNKIYDYGILGKEEGIAGSQTLYLLKNNEASRIRTEELIRPGNIPDFISESLRELRLQSFETYYNQLFFDIIKPNVSYDSVLSKKELE